MIELLEYLFVPTIDLVQRMHDFADALAARFPFSLVGLAIQIDVATSDLPPVTLWGHDLLAGYAPMFAVARAVIAVYVVTASVMTLVRRITPQPVL